MLPPKKGYCKIKQIKQRVPFFMILPFVFDQKRRMELSVEYLQIFERIAKNHCPLRFRLNQIHCKCLLNLLFILCFGARDVCATLRDEI